jgi:hypothetical protein
MNYSQSLTENAALHTAGLRPSIRDAKNSPPSDSSALLSLSGYAFLRAFRNSANLLACFTTSACIEKPVQSAIGSVRRGMCIGTKPTLMLSMTTLSNGSSSTCVGVLPEGSTNRNGPLVLSEAKREVRAGGGVRGSLIVTGRAADSDSDSKAPFQIVRWKFSLDGRGVTHSCHGMFWFL